MNKDFPEVRISKTITWLLRHGAKGEGLVMREDGYVQVHDLLANRRLKGQGLSWEMLKDIVEKDRKRRYALVFEGESWWIRANQGHSIKTVQMEMTPVLSVRDIPTGIAVHGTTLGSWQSIATQGLSRMKRNHIHLAQGLPGENVTSGMRKLSQVFIYINIEKAIEAGIKFYLSENGVVLSTGDEDGILKPEFFEKIVDAKGELLLS
ncbi:hypothetical protein AMATHDRAFT_143591 [Amanita thiersii Skay4041]|uniref:2'-phosphotransferase n=1 Tax=Amanita thiersii Skay4041 TaxID=703135 RepID=A0A2A9NLN4_9AGAR|nr:hypothetical protein AMATHDRAFT_143591 [Amanita thiersii Skay4041]